MSIFGTSALDEKQRELDQLVRDHNIAERHRIEKEELKEQHRIDLETYKNSYRDQETIIERKDNLIGALQEKLNYEQEKRQLIIDAEVKAKLGEYETRYYHDLHTFMEGHGNKFNDFQMGFMTQVLAAIKELKPTEPKVYIMDKSGSVDASKPKQEKQS